MLALRIVAFCLLLGGCGTQVAALYGVPIVDPASEASITPQVSINSNPHTGLIEVTGPVVFQKHDLLDDNYLIRSWISPRRPEAEDKFQILVTGKYPKRVYLKQAYADGAMLSTTVIDRERKACRDDCIIDEVVGINLSESEMADYSRRGLSFQILGRRASLDMSIPAAYFDAVLEAHRRARRNGLMDARS